MITIKRTIGINEMIRVLALAICCLFSSSNERAMGGIFTHGRLVAASGIRTMQHGTHEGIGMSSRSFIDASNRACYWGKRQAISVQYSQRGGMFYAVVKYR